MNFISKLVFILLATIATQAQAQDSWFKYEVNKPYTFVGESKETIQQNAGGQTLNVTLESNTSYSITVLSYTEDGSMNAQIDIKSAISFQESPKGLETFGDDLTKKTYLFTIDKQGHLIDIDSTLKAVKPQSQTLVVGMMDFLPELPADKLVDGESWTMEVKDTSGTDEQPILIDRETEYEIDGTAEVDGVSTLHIKFEGEISLEGELTTRGMDRVLMGEGTVTGNIYFAKDLGIVKKTVISSKIEEVYSQPSNPGSQAVVTRTETSTIEQIAD